MHFIFFALRVHYFFCVQMIHASQNNVFSTGGGGVFCSADLRVMQLLVPASRHKYKSLLVIQEMTQTLSKAVGAALPLEASPSPISWDLRLYPQAFTSLLTCGKKRFRREPVQILHRAKS